MFSPNKLPQDFRFFIFLGEEEEEKKGFKERRKTLTRSAYRIFMFIFASAVQKTFFISPAPNLTGATLLLSTITSTMMMMVMMMYVGAGAGVADAAMLLTPITSEIEKLDLHQHYLHYSHPRKNSCGYFIILQD